MSQKRGAPVVEADGAAGCGIPSVEKCLQKMVSRRSLSRGAPPALSPGTARYLETVLKLKVNPALSRVAPMRDCSFLSFTIRGNKVRWADKALVTFKHRVRELTGRGWGVSMDYRLQQLGRYARGWMAYFCISQYYRPVPDLDEWLRRRICMCYWKQWRWARTKICHLLALGVSLKSAIQHGVSSLGWWHMARTPVTQQAMSNAWLAAQGLVSLKALWKKAQGYST